MPLAHPTQQEALGAVRRFPDSTDTGEVNFRQENMRRGRQDTAVCKTESPGDVLKGIQA